MEDAIISLSPSGNLQFALRTEKGEYDLQSGSELSRTIGMLLFKNIPKIRQTIDKLTETIEGRTLLSYIIEKNGIHIVDSKYPEIIEFIGKQTYEGLLKELVNSGVLIPYSWWSRKHTYTGYKLLPYIDNYIKDSLGIGLTEIEQFILGYFACQYLFRWGYCISSEFIWSYNKALHDRFIAWLTGKTEEDVKEYIDSLKAREFLDIESMWSTTRKTHWGNFLVLTSKGKRIASNFKEKMENKVVNKIKMVFSDVYNCAIYRIFVEKKIHPDILKRIRKDNTDFLQKIGIIDTLKETSWGTKEPVYLEFKGNTEISKIIETGIHNVEVSRIIEGILNKIEVLIKEAKKKEIPEGGKRVVETGKKIKEIGIKIYLGKSDRGRDIYWNPGKEKNPHLLIVGTTGAGKTQTLKAIIYELNRLNIPCLIFDFHNEYDFGTILDLDKITVNPLELEDESPKNRVYQISSSLRAIYKLGDQQEAQLRIAIRESYQRHGIYDNQKKSWNSPLPTFAEIKRILEEKKKEKNIGGTIITLLNRLEPLFDVDVFSAKSTLPLTGIAQKTTTIKLKELPTDEIRTAITEIILRKVWNHMYKAGSSSKLRLFLIIDEGHRLAYEKSPIDQITREARKYGMGIILSTQRPSDFEEPILANIGAFIALQCVIEKDAKYMSKQLRCLPKDLQDLTEKGRAIVKFSSLHDPINVKIISYDQRVKGISC